MGGIFYDYHNSGDWNADFAFTQDVGRAFLDVYAKIVRRNMNTPWARRTVRSNSSAAAVTSNSTSCTIAARVRAEDGRKRRFDPFLDASRRQMAVSPPRKATTQGPAGQRAEKTHEKTKS